VDILSKLPADFYTRAQSPKWQNRKEALEELQVLLAPNPKLESRDCDYGDLVRILKGLISKDSNVLIVAMAGNCVAGLAAGLKKKFAPFAPSCLPIILEKFKEKKAVVLTAMRAAADACFLAVSLIN
jgi:cytoskeleton-associated protein 5